MQQDDFYEMFYSNLKEEFEDEYVDSIENLINTKKFTKGNFMKLIEGEIK